MRCQIIFTDPDTKEWSLNDIKHIDEIGSRFAMSDQDMDCMEAAVGRGEYFTLPDRRFAAYPIDTIPGQVPEVIEGRGQFRAGYRAIATHWHNSREAAVEDSSRLRPAISLEQLFDISADCDEFVRRHARLMLPQYRRVADFAATFDDQARRNYDHIARERQAATQPSSRASGPGF